MTLDVTGEHYYHRSLGGVRSATIYRDLRALEDLGFPISGDVHGYKSRPRLREGYQAKLMSIPFTIPKLAAICFSAALTENLTGTALHGALQEAIAKIRSHVPTASCPCSTRPPQSSAPSRKATRTADTLGRLVQAMLESRRCELTYQSPHRSEPLRFSVDPYKLFEFGGSLYCFAYVPKHDQVITLAIDRIKALEPTEETFTVSPNFSFEDLRDQAFGVIGGEPMTVKVQFRQDQVPYVKERIWHPTQTFEDLPNGDTIMTFQAGGEFEIMRWLLGWGSAVEVLEPGTLRHAIQMEARLIRETYLGNPDNCWVEDKDE